jgi:TatD DNase family protein
MQRLVDVHAHIHHRAFEGERDAVVARAEAAGLAAIVENGLDRTSNRSALELAARHPIVRAALGVYPVNAVAHRVQHWEASLRPELFDVAEEIAFIEARARAGEIAAIGECGMDGHWVKEWLDEQREVFVEMVRLAIRVDLPLVVHSRSAERECVEVLEREGARRVDLHCFGGKLALAERAARNGWYISVPPVVTRSSSFQALARRVGPERVLTETDCPYQGPRKDERNEPAFVAEGAAALGRVWGLGPAEAAARIWQSYCELFRVPWAA